MVGTLGLVLASAVQVAGTVASFVSGLANALVFDPISQQQSAILSGFMANIAVLLLFATNMHHLMIQAIVDSYQLFEPGAALLTGDILQVLARGVNTAYKVGIQLAAPFLVVSFAYYVVLGVMTRLSPQIPIFFVAMPVQIMIGLAVAMVTISGIMLVFLEHFREGGTIHAMSVQSFRRNRTAL